MKSAKPKVKQVEVPKSGSVSWIGGRVTVLGLEPGTKLYWCSRRWIVTRYVRRRLTYWRVPEIATTLRIGRWEFQHLPAAMWREDG